MLRHLAWTLALVAIAAGTASAQEPLRPARRAADDDASGASPERASPDSDRARELFSQARVAREEGRLGDAEWALAESLRLYPRPSTALNLALVRQSLGRLRGAATVLVDLERGAFGETDADLMRAAADLRNTVEAELVTVVVRAPQSAGAEAHIDGESVGRIPAGGRLELRVDPGPHDLELVAANSTSEVRRFVGSRGQRLQLDLELSAGSPVTASDPSPDSAAEADEDSGGSVWSSPLFWALAFIVLAGVGAGIGIAVATSGGQSTVADPAGIYPVIEALSF